MSGVDTELALVAVAAMLSPTTLTFSILVLVLGERPLRTGIWFYLGALGATLGIGIVAAFVLGDAAASHTSTPKTWVLVFDLLAGILLLGWVVRALRKPRNPEKEAKMAAQMGKVASSPAVAILGAGAALANPGAFIPIALKAISQTDPSAAGYAAQWIAFSLISLLPLATAIVLLLLVPDRARRVLAGARRWLERNARTVAAVIVVALALALIRNGIAGLM
ncbi:MAG TPA: GAP family protein [Gaiellaceae bacterium]|nr:GAP family protein [Gaiellaceae bacterium]